MSVPPANTIAELAGLAGRTVSRWARDGIPDYAADRLAAAAGAHPGEIWPEWWDE